MEANFVQDGCKLDYTAVAALSASASAPLSASMSAKGGEGAQSSPVTISSRGHATPADWLDECERRGWTPDGCPTPEHLKKIGMDLPEVLEVVKGRMEGRL